MDGNSRKRLLLPARAVLLSLALFAVVPPSLSAGYLFLQFAESQRKQAELGLINSAEGVARALDNTFREALMLLRILRLSELLDTENLPLFEIRLRNTTDYTGRGFLLIDSSGKLIINTAPSPRLPLAPDEVEEMMTTLRAQDFYISNVVNDAGSQEPLAVIGVPVVRGSEPRWFLVTLLYGSDLEPLIQRSGVPEDWVVSLVDRQGTHIRRSHLNDQFAGKPLVQMLVDHVANFRTGIVRTVSLEEIPLISTVAYGPVSGWATAVGLPVEKLEAPMRRSLQTLAAVGFGLAIVVLILAYVIVRMLDNGFQGLREATRALGRHDVVLPRRSAIREFHDVGQTMERASRELEKSKSELEKKVEERTADLVSEMQQREKSEAQLHQVQKMQSIGQLTGGIAHDFNNMLAVVMGALSIVQRRLARGDSDGIPRLVDNAMQGAESAAKLTQQLLAFSRQQALNPELTDCNRLIADISELLRRTLPETIEIETVLAGGLWRTQVDRPGLESVLLNIAVNARDAMPDGGMLTIETSNAHLDEGYAAIHADVVSGQYVLIALTDTGDGIPRDNLEKVFEPFFTTKETGHGTGLGLSQVYGFVKQSGGHIKLYSEVGSGTMVRIYFPRAVQDGKNIAVRKSKKTEFPLSQKNETILVVEDDAGVRANTLTMLAELGYTALEAENGEGALAVLGDHPEVSLVISDVVMPSMNGRQLANELENRYPHLPILFMTGYTRNAIVHSGRLDPGVTLLAKPYTITELAEAVHGLLGDK